MEGATGSALIHLRVTFTPTADETIPPFHFARQRSFSALTFVLLSACHDDAGPAAPRLTDPQPSLALAGHGALRDDGIDLRDTYFAVNVTTTRTVEGDAASNDLPAIAVESEYAANESAYLEAGYGADGVLRFNVYSDGAADSRLPAPPPVVRSVGNDVSIYDEWGTVVEAYHFDTFLEGTGLPGGDLALGSPYGTLYNPLGQRSGGAAGSANPRRSPTWTPKGRRYGMSGRTCCRSPRPRTARSARRLRR